MMAAAKKHRHSALDQALFGFITRRWDAAKIANYEDTLRHRDKMLSAETTHTFASIDTKATGLLTHTSTMIAGLGLIAPLVADSELEVGIVVAEIAVYLLIALGWLRCISVFRTYEFAAADEHAQSIIHRELVIRTEALQPVHPHRDRIHQAGALFLEPG
jgi:hypothetical protein